MNIYIESMTRFEFQRFTVRCWRMEESYDLQSEIITRRDIETVLNNMNTDAAHLFSLPQYIALAVLELDRMNAVEVLDSEGNGCVIYKDWP